MTKVARDTVVFDLGGVLIDWDPRHLYRKLFAGNEAAMEHFLGTVCTHEWNRGQDAGRAFAEGARLLKAEHPDKAELIPTRIRSRAEPAGLQGLLRRAPGGDCEPRSRA
jgi:FMN phosphatase YigB (HAD superfamily)